MVDSLLSDATSHYSVPWAIASLNAHIFELAATNANIFVFDFHAWQAANGRASFDDKMTYFARQPIARGAIGSFASAIARTIAPVIRPAAKVLALDLDNVLWGGILGEDGASGVAIGHDFPGNIYFAIQSRARALRDRGTMLALVSKNDLAVVEEAFLSRPEMILHLSDFSAVRVNWLPKHENIASIAKELNIGVESIVFLDDQPFERETVRYHLPEVHVLECSSDALSILSALESTNAFDTLRIGDADLTRIKDYEAQRERRSAAEGTEVSDFLRSLDLRMSIEAITSRTLDRAHQMLQKTNQFNVTTRRHSRADLERLLDDGALGLTITVADRFGDQGIVGLAIATRSGPRAEIDSFLLSCRALGRGAELALWSELIRRLIDHGITEVHATYERTAKNEQVMDLFDRFSMTLESADERRRSYRATLPLDAPFPDWVTRIEAAVNA
jgi:FkbH-like protein